MIGKSGQPKRHGLLRLLFALVAPGLFAFAPNLAIAAGGDSSEPVSKFLGVQSCSSSSCHGGAGNNRDQFVVWSKYDYHHARPFATLETARADRIAEVLKAGDPTRSPACTVCHAPLQTVPISQMARSLPVGDGVTCENCHGPAESWLRGHTRHDWTHENRIQSGMRDLRNLYVRANTCVACHQTLENDIRQAGHPELIFELDGQAVSQPRHWLGVHDKPGPQIWMVGQAVALREMSWQLLREKSPEPTLVLRWAAVAWILQTTITADTKLPALAPSFLEPTSARLEEVRAWSDHLAKEAAEFSWTPATTKRCLTLLLESRNAFASRTVPVPLQARRAERLVLALDRLMLGLVSKTASPPANAELDALFEDVQSLPDFDPEKFAKDLQQLNASSKLDPK
jgi:hypothetical protein